MVITVGLGAAGFVAGGAVGMVMMAFMIMSYGGLAELVRDPGILLFAGTFGGTVGAVLGPVAAWLLMRRVPLWLAVGGTAAGTITGAVLGLVMAGFEGSFVSALLGFGASAVVLRLRKPFGPRAIAAPDGPGIARARHGV